MLRTRSGKVLKIGGGAEAPTPYFQGYFSLGSVMFSPPKTSLEIQRQVLPQILSPV